MPRTPVTLPGTEQRLMTAASNGVGYKLYVSLPPGYAASDDRYPVVYLLDADYSFAIARNIVEHLSDRGDLPAAIVVGIAYDGPAAYQRNRTRDYTPTNQPTGGYGVDIQKVSGQAPAFKRFIAEELVPMIERDYRASSTRVLVGHSYGGLFAAWTAITSPGLFAGFVIVSPSLWYDDRMMFALEAKANGPRQDLEEKIYMTVGSREINAEHDMVRDLERFAAALRSHHYPGLQLRSEVADDETHNSIFPSGLGRGLRFVLGGR